MVGRMTRRGLGRGELCQNVELELRKIESSRLFALDSHLLRR